MVKGLNREEFDMMLKRRENGVNEVSVLRRVYGDYDIGCKNWSLYKVKKGKVWYSKESRRK